MVKGLEPTPPTTHWAASKLGRVRADVVYSALSSSSTPPRSRLPSLNLEENTLVDKYEEEKLMEENICIMYPVSPP